jgi:hypothetical protein
MTVVEVEGVRPNGQSASGFPIGRTTSAVKASWLPLLPVITMSGRLGYKYFYFYQPEMYHHEDPAYGM